MNGPKLILGTVLGLAWASAIGFGARSLLRYENTPGEAGDPLRNWPRESRLLRPADRFALVLFAHPNCPCTRASLAELEILMARLKGRVAAFVRFRKPEANLSEVQSSDLWKKASSIPGVSAGFDANGLDVRQFGAETSGQALLYDLQGRLVFSGGITTARGHEGDNAGVDAVIARVNGREAPFHTSAFGCSLRDPGTAELRENPAWKKP